MSSLQLTHEAAIVSRVLTGNASERRDSPSREASHERKTGRSEVAVFRLPFGPAVYASAVTFQEIV